MALVNKIEADKAIAQLKLELGIKMAERAAADVKLTEAKKKLQKIKRKIKKTEELVSWYDIRYEEAVKIVKNIS